MKFSIRKKLLILILGALLLLALILGGISMFFTSRLTDEYANQYVSLMCQNKAIEINSTFSSLEQSVNYMSINALEEISNPMNLADEIYLDNYIDKMRSILWSTSNNTDSAIAAYLRLNPSICGPVAGIFLSRDELDSDMKKMPITDLSVYDESDTEYVGWYYQPLNAGEPIWMLPYYNQNIDVYMISYVVPLFKNTTTVGVLGMDINFDYITEMVKSIKIYKSGYAYITDSDEKVIYHPTMKIGEMVSEKAGWLSAEKTLTNGMVLHITVPLSEINESRNMLLRNIYLSSIIIIIIFILITIGVTRKMIAPLQKLNQIANEISAGNYDVDFNFARPSDEIGQLTQSFENTVVTLKEYMTYINGLAYKDSLTGVRNRTAYDHQILAIEEALQNGEDLAVVIAVFDVNNLKRINDNLGHEKGDVLINGACKMICRAFSHSAVFRIGGDEFVAIIRDVTDEKVIELFDQFMKDMEVTWTNEAPEERISVAYGYSKYDKDKDNYKIEPSFKRADEIMYENKKAIKARQQEGRFGE